jgi:hypothetical protein
VWVQNKEYVVNADYSLSPWKIAMKVKDNVLVEEYIDYD